MSNRLAFSAGLELAIAGHYLNRDYTHGTSLASTEPVERVRRTASLVSIPWDTSPHSSDDLVRDDQQPATLPLSTLKGALRQPPTRVGRSREATLKSSQTTKIERTKCVLPSVIQMPNSTKFTPFSPASSLIDGNFLPKDSMQRDPALLPSFPSYALNEGRTKLLTANVDRYRKRILSQRINDYFLRQPLSSIESLLKERSIATAAEETIDRSDNIKRTDRTVKKRFYLS